MYCKNCGAFNPDGAEFCTVCGAALAPKSKGRHKIGLSKNKLIAIIASAVAVIALIVVIAVAAKSAKPAYVKAALQAVDDLLSLDAERTAKAYYPEPFWDHYDIDNRIDDCTDDIEGDIEYYYDEYDIDLKKLFKAVKVELKGTEKVKRSEIKSMNKYCEDYIDADDDFISEAWLVELKVSLTWKDRNLDKKFDRNETCEVLVVKIDGKWYAIDDDGSRCSMRPAFCFGNLRECADPKKQSFFYSLYELWDKLENKLD